MTPLGGQHDGSACRDMFPTKLACRSHDACMTQNISGHAHDTQVCIGDQLHLPHWRLRVGSKHTQECMLQALALACWPRRIGMATSSTTTRASTRAATCSGHSGWHTTAPGVTAAASTPAKLTCAKPACRSELLLHDVLSAKPCFLGWARRSKTQD